VVDDTLSNHDTKNARSSYHTDDSNLLGKSKRGLILGSADRHFTNEQPKKKAKSARNECMEFGGNKNMQMNDLNHLRHKTSQFKQGYTNLI
jgi:hypothetical protein